MKLQFLNLFYWNLFIWLLKRAEFNDDFVSRCIRRKNDRYLSKLFAYCRTYHYAQLVPSNWKRFDRTVFLATYHIRKSRKLNQYCAYYAQLVPFLLALKVVRSDSFLITYRGYCAKKANLIFFSLLGQTEMYKIVKVQKGQSWGQTTH